MKFKLAQVSFKILAFVTLLPALSGCLTIQVKYNTKVGRDRNVCKKLTGKVVVYAIFVDNKYTKPWTDFDIETTKSAIQSSMAWVEAQAAKDSIDLNIQIEYFQIDTVKTIHERLPRKSIAETVFLGYNPIASMNRWGNKVASQVNAYQQYKANGDSLILDPEFTRERLIASLRNKHSAEHVALMYFVNNYYIDDISVPVNTGSSKEIEYAIVSYKREAVIAHEFLHLFGASDLYRQLYGKRKHRKLALKYFPNDIMQAIYEKDLEGLEVGDLTKYLIGWKDTYDQKWERLFIEWHRRRIIWFK